MGIGLAHMAYDRFEFRRCLHYAIVPLIALLVAGVLLRPHQRVSASQRAHFQTLDVRPEATSPRFPMIRYQNQQLPELMALRPTGEMARIIAGRNFAGERTLSPASRLDALVAASPDISDEAARRRRLTTRILNTHRLAQIARAHMLASIPSVNPAGKAAVVGCYCYRNFPTAEFHAGVDLDANYGDVVRASAAGTVVSAAYDGAYGLKVDLDHGNGYHTWYAHLSRADVHAGQQVAKSQPIALVGSTGRSTGPHLHYQVMLKGKPVDPEPFLKGIPPQVLAALP